MLSPPVISGKPFEIGRKEACQRGKLPLLSPTLSGDLMSYAIIQSGGRQFRVQTGDVIDVELLGVEAGKKAVFEEVLLASDGKDVKIGDPLVKGAKVTGEVIESEHKAPKVVSYKFKRRKGYHRTVGHRQKHTRVKIGEIKA
jgi:large subunit ribosomal protein L21